MLYTNKIYFRVPLNINFLSEPKRKAPDARRPEESIAIYELC
jgi:hypothetical protein